jgi:probable rRNA maturation factor
VRGGDRILAVSSRHRRLRFAKRELAAAVGALDAHAARFKGGCPGGELSVALLTDTALARLHGTYLGDPSATDVITFEGDPAHGVAGEICVSVDAAARVAGRGAPGLSGELTLYVVHGWLHLAGYDDRRPADKRVMRRAEARAMAILRCSAQVPRFKLA